jgi:hypothetical protein
MRPSYFLFETDHQRLVVDEHAGGTQYRWEQTLKAVGSLDKPSKDQHTLCLTQNGAGRFKIELDNIVVDFNHENDKGWPLFFETQRKELIALLIRFFYEREEEDYFWLVQIDDTLHHLQLVWEKDQGIGRGEYHSVPDKSYRVTNLYFWEREDVDRGFSWEQQAKTMYGMLTDSNGLGLSAGFPLFSQPPITIEENSRKQLVVRLPPMDLRLSLLPFQGFSEYHCGRFYAYRRFRYIFTDKPFLLDLIERKDIAIKMDQIDLFIQKSIIILNEYDHFKDQPAVKALCDRGTNLVLRIKPFFTNVQLTSGPATLRILDNCSPEDILDEFKKTNDTNFVFGNFHTVSGRWTVNEKWRDNRFFEEILALDLKHILRLRVFHCNSILNDGYEPGIVPQLLGKGVRIAEGSNLKESYLVYLFTLIFLFIRSKLVLFIDDEDLISDCERYLNDLREIKPDLYAYD